jgi:hypothetical protein
VFTPEVFSQMIVGVFVFLFAFIAVVYFISLGVVKLIDIIRGRNRLPKKAKNNRKT